MNKVILIGRFTKDPESRMTQSNVEVSRFSLACSSDFVNRNGDRETVFINCLAFNKLASTINRYCKKGMLISATGRIKNNSYEAKDGTKKYSTDVVIDQMEFLSSKNNEEKIQQVSAENSAENSVASSQNTVDPYEQFGEEFQLTGDELPF